MQQNKYFFVKFCAQAELKKSNLYYLEESKGPSNFVILTECNHGNGCIQKSLH